MHVAYTPGFLRMLKALPALLQEEAIEKIEQFKDEKNHAALKVHKLKGRLAGRYGFSVNYHVRIIFTFLKTKPREALLLAIGDHDVYG